MKTFYLTATGNSLYVAGHVGGELISIPRVLREGARAFDDDTIGIVFPCYFFGTPHIVRRFVETTQLKASYVFAIITYGNHPGGAFRHFSNIARRSGLTLSYLNHIRMVDNYLPMFEMEAQVSGAPGKHIDRHLETIVRDIRAGKKAVRQSHLPWTVLTALAQWGSTRKKGRGDENFTVEDSCNQCGICEKVCPVDNIRLNGKPSYLHHCEECLACTHNCPQNAIRLKKERSRERFRNEHVDLNEIVRANG